MTRTLVWLLLITAALTAPAYADGFARRFAGDGVTLTLGTAPEGGYVGALGFEGQTYLVRAQANGASLEGRFRVDGQAFTFAATLQGDVLTLTSGGQTYQLRAQAAAGGNTTGSTGSTGGNATGSTGGNTTGSTGGNTTGSRPAAGPIVMTQHTLNDPQSRNMPSHTLLAPKGWTVSGGAWWANPRYFNVLPSHDIKVQAPDGREVHLAPSIIAKDFIPPANIPMPRPQEGVSDKGIPIIYMPAGLDGWRQWLTTRGVPQSFPGATDIRVDNGLVIPELTAGLRRTMQPLWNMIEQNRQLDAQMGTRSSYDAAVLAFECHYTHEDRAWHQLLIFGTSYTTTESELTGRMTIWEVNPSISYRAPAGQLEPSLPLLFAIANSLRMTDAWARQRLELQAKLNKISADMAREAADAAMKRSRLLAKTNSEISDIIHQGFRDREAIRDATHRKVVTTIRGTEDYVTPSGGTVELPNTYDRVYSNGQGDYLLTNDQLYDPNTDPTFNGSSWQGIQPKR